MGKTFIITPKAQRDFDRAYWWYEEQHEGLGKEFARCADVKIAEVRRNPEHYGVIYKDVVRRALVIRFL